jgi:hypothetical protein
MSERRWDEGLVFEKLRHIWPSPGYVRLPQVRNGTGYARSRTTTADALVLSVWPSRGLWIAGVEIKVSLADWKKELAKPDKADEIQKYCHYWYVAAPKGVIPIATLPELWGLVEVNGNTAEICKQAPRLNPKPVDLLFLCAALRAAEDVTVSKAGFNDEVKKQVDVAVQAEQRNKKYDYERLHEAVKAFEEASGISLWATWDAGNIGAAVAFVRKSKIQSVEGCIENLALHCERTAEGFREALENYRKGITEA